MSAGATGADARRNLPSVDELLRQEGVEAWVVRWGRGPVAGALREAIASVRAHPHGVDVAALSEHLLGETLRILSSDRPSLRTVVNATGVILHTNLGRAPLARAASTAAAEVAGGYSSLEYDLEGGARGDRYTHCTDLASQLTGAEASLVVNNNAAAVSLAISTLANGRDVIVSRGELVEIWGGFRLPEVIERSGAFLCAVGTTNRTRVEDYRRAITPSTGLLLKIHPSNYRVEGFVEETSLKDLVDLGRSAGVPVMHDLGSGLMFEDDLPGLEEPSVKASVGSGADIVAWSGDKLLGGPQAGILQGRESTLARLRANPLLRAFRVDKMTLAALEATLRLYRSPERARRHIPVLRMLTETAEVVETRARAAHGELSPAAARLVSVVPMRSVLGGGTAPGFEIASAGWRLSGHAGVMESGLRGHDPPVISRIEEGSCLLDFRTVLEGQQGLLTTAVERVVTGEDTGS
ncbi:MAG: L-seryl-tRNA(Sec) selenium transferase [marine benthic group bacterium]|nr:L-seryl-tRNA(Sec) selenium transferase [Gemmatimonadota bacterium]